MSNIGLNANTYYVTGKYLDLLNEFMTRTRTNESLSEMTKVDVISFISKVQDENSIDPQIQLLSSIIERDLRHHKRNPSVFLSSLLNELNNNNVAAILGKIELVIAALDNEHFEALSKIKGKR